MTASYDSSFFSNMRYGTSASAAKIAPLLMQIVQPKSVVDIGCGTGDWLAVLSDLGISDFLGVDGDYLDPNLLAIPPSHFRSLDLSGPIDLGRRFDLAISLEVAEHLPPSAADAFIGMLTRLAPVVAFSAAIPGQGGTGHINEQWPDYWAKLFASRSYRVIDVLRPQIWDDPEVEPWYKQNMFLYVAEAEYDRYRAEVLPMPLRVVHPDLFGSPTLHFLLRSAPAAAGRSLAGVWTRRRRAAAARGE